RALSIGAERTLLSKSDFSRQLLAKIARFAPSSDTLANAKQQREGSLWRAIQRDVTHPPGQAAARRESGRETKMERRSIEHRSLFSNRYLIDGARRLFVRIPIAVKVALDPASQMHGAHATDHKIIVW